MEDFAQKFKVDLGVGCKERNSKGWIEKTNAYSKRLTQKCAQDRRRNSYGKLLNSTTSNNKVSKKNKPNEITTCKRKVGNFDENEFVHWACKDGIGHFNDWVIANGGAEKDKHKLKLFLQAKNRSLQRK